MSTAEQGIDTADAENRMLEAGRLMAQAVQAGRFRDALGYATEYQAADAELVRLLAGPK